MPEDENFITKILEILPELCQRCFSCRRQKKKSDVHESFCELFCQNDQFEETNFFEVLDNPDLIPEFKITK
jgi:hypothetical protein